MPRGGTFNLLVGGPKVNWPEDFATETDGSWIGVDRGTLRLIDLNIQPVAAIGDFDSLAAPELQRVRRNVKDIRQAQVEKDFTDTQMAVSVAFNDYGAERVDIYGATGGRLDHFLANLFLVLEPRFKRYAGQIRLIDRQNTVSFYLPGRHTIQKEADKKYLAFVPLTPIDHLSLLDEKYQLHNEPIPYPISFASNEFVGETGTFQFDTGLLGVIQSRDTYEARHE
ncbi:thiamine diphosphokinase [Levilactobacillus brevis]|uniref:Thiamine diphosphokinase n=4 Tax=Levilactobacillus brevis TaxID=1580 RepID=Q03RS9_LEVBA|nr:thiamine diphosphokinase [Levilactobacillus brevis]MBL3536593.1 thiamine diphosphokinase [Lactobacillus sp. GPR40-2]MBL3629751.1 thiamine diphosphokinase [Lactobacillus sp. GPB7-4]ABJ64093.1 Thiamine pyrophosphokinase [Levilactobacillus brevis ATCC 367]ARQ93851.1 thiamine pyrophosphokinase [Levilactobacillus brevis]ARW22010.1 Thiamine diphosphokinase [Levilactobacillus brevis]